MKAVDGYKLMTRAERRVAIAKDVIKRINAGKVKPASGNTYVDTDGYLTIDQKNAGELLESCPVCVRGALMLSRIAKYNGVEIEVKGQVFREDTSFALSDAFNVRQLQAIESAFEVTPFWTYSTPPQVFGADFESDSDRLLAICQNIIDHNGTFRSNVRYEVKACK